MNFKFTIIVEGLKPSISTPYEFYDVFQYVPMPLKNLLCELYLHNLAVPNDRAELTLICRGCAIESNDVMDTE